MNSKQTQQVTIKAIGTPAIREGVRQWLAGAPRKELAGRKDLSKAGFKRFRDAIMQALGAKTWAQALVIRKQAKKQAKRAAKVEKKEAKDAASQRRAA